MKWLSPYQQEAYNKVLENLRIDTMSLNAGKNKVYFNKLASTRLTAWEVENNLWEKVDEVNSQVAIDTWVLEGESVYEKTDWKTGRYYTLFLKKTDNLFKKYKPSTRRNIRKAMRNGLQFGTAQSSTLDRCLSLFETRKELRGNLDVKLFSSLSKSLISKNLGRFHFVRYKGKIIAASLVIYSPEVMNIRYITSNQNFLHLRPVNFLYHSLVKHYLDKNWKYIDLSGIIPPGYPNQKLLDISRFKRGFSDLVLSFRKV